MNIIGLVLIIVGLLLTLHDLFYHLTGKYGFGKEIKIKGIRIHHLYIGVILMLTGLISL